MEETSAEVCEAISPRRKNMQASRRRDTRPELALRSPLHASGHRYRVDFRIDFPGARVRPDILFTRRRVAVFVDGCFWHSCPDHGAEPKVHRSYWSPKLQGNRERAERNNTALREQGWTVLRIWEHAPPQEAFAEVVVALGTRTLIA